jgi:hypothetical protein
MECTASDDGLIKNDIEGSDKEAGITLASVWRD